MRWSFPQKTVSGMLIIRGIQLRFDCRATTPGEYVAAVSPAHRSNLHPARPNSRRLNLQHSSQCYEHETDTPDRSMLNAPLFVIVKLSVNPID